MLIGLVLLLSVLSAEAAHGGEVQVRHGRAELISNRSGDVAGREILLGVHFILENGWHIYWKNPGDSGQPPSFTWTLPAGSTAGEIQWPRPERLQSSTAIADYGYRNEVLLMVPVHLSALPAMNSGQQIGVDAKWLICREVCLPDHAHLTLPPAGAARNSSRTTLLFAKAKTLLPRAWPKQWEISAESLKEDFVLTIVAGKSISHAEFFPADPGQIENAAKQKIEPAPAGAKLFLKKSDLLLKPISRLRGVLALGGARAYEVDAQVRTPSR